jgi:hypothetical protein
MSDKNYRTKRLQELKDFLHHTKTNPCRAPVTKAVMNVEHVHDYLLRGSFIPTYWVNDADLVEFEIVPISDEGVFIKRGYPRIQLHVATWETMQPSISFFLDKISDSEYHYIEAIAYHSAFKLLPTRIPHTVMVEFAPTL